MELNVKEALREIELDRQNPEAEKIRQDIAQVAERIAGKTEEEAEAEISSVRGKAVKIAREGIRSKLLQEMKSRGIPAHIRRRRIRHNEANILREAQKVVDECADAYRVKAANLRAWKQVDAV